jgi:hypothetical protein
MELLGRADWTTRRDTHQTRVDALIGDHRCAAENPHPVVDFLFTYYSFRPAQLRRWHPGYGVALADADEYAQFSGYTAVADGTTVDHRLLDRRRGLLDFVADLLAQTASRPAHLGCFGLHEWAMVYRADETRHSVPLRLGRAGTDAVVESLPLRCSHFDAYRFFTPDAAPRNAAPLTCDAQRDDEQPGCLHAGMDLYGHTPVPIETPAGRAEYTRTQSALATRAAILRTSLLSRCRDLLAQQKPPYVHAVIRSSGVIATMPDTLTPESGGKGTG